MLTNLRIEHFAIVKKLELDFSPGMSTFTGETGAGKSIMIDALMLALGSRADASVIRPGEEKCDITATFSFDPNSEPATWLAQHDIPCEESTLYLRRIITSEGRSKSSINGHPFPLQKIKELSEKLVLIHGQHQHHSLMHHATHRQQLDNYANHSPLLDEVEHWYKQYQHINQEIEFLTDLGQQADKVKLLQFQVEELTALNLQEGEIEALHQEHQLLHHAQDYLTHSQLIYTLLNGDDKQNCCTILNQINHLITKLPHSQTAIKNSAELINSALIQCQEAANEIEQFANAIPLDTSRLSEIEQRMSAIHAIARKYHLDSLSLPDHLRQLEQELILLREAENKRDQLCLQRDLFAENYTKAALNLRQSRQQYAHKIAQELTSSIQKLGMPKGWIKLEITPLDKMHVHGQDKIEYKVCTNPGMEPDSLSKIVSGGELSRIGLAIQMITAQRGSTPTLLFDEVDVGIGGPTAALIGQMLRALGERLQVFCVTHQPQVAASAHHHFKVSKDSDDQHTFTQIIELNLVEKINEIARMLGGLTITEQTRCHAQELLAQSTT